MSSIFPFIKPYGIALKLIINLLLLIVGLTTLGQDNSCICNIEMFGNEKLASSLFNRNIVSNLRIKSAHIKVQNNTLDNPKFKITFDSKGYISTISSLNSKGGSKTSFYRDNKGLINTSFFNYLDSNGKKSNIGKHKWKYYYNKGLLVKRVQLYSFEEHDESSSSNVINYQYPSSKHLIEETIFNTKCKNCRKSKFLIHQYTFREKEKQSFKIINNDSTRTVVRVLNKRESIVQEKSLDSPKKLYNIFNYQYDESNNLITIEMVKGITECRESDSFKTNFKYSNQNIPISAVHKYGNNSCTIKIEYK